MTAKQQLKMAEEQIAFWKAQAATARKALKAAKKKTAKATKKAMPYRYTRNGVTVRSTKPIRRGRDGLVHGERVSLSKKQKRASKSLRSTKATGHARI